MPGNTPVRRVGAIQHQLEGSNGRVLQIAALRWISRWPGVRRLGNSEFGAAAIIGGLPLASCALQQATTGDVDWFVWVTAAIYGALIALMLLSALHSWARVIALGRAIDAILDGKDGSKVAISLEKALSLTPQVVIFAFGVLASTVVGVFLSGPLGSHAGNAGLAYTLTIGWTGGIGGVTVYWLWGAPVLLYPLAHTEDPKLDWIAPLQTPAVQAASRLMIDGSRLAAAGLLLFTIPIALTVALADRTWSVWVLSVSSLLFSLFTVLGCALLPQMALTDLVRRGKAQTLKCVRRELPDLKEVLASPTPQLLETVELYERLAKAPVSIIDWKRLLEYGLLLLSSIAPIAIAVLSSK